MSIVRPDVAVSAHPSVVGLAETDAAAVTRVLGDSADALQDEWSVKQMQAMIGAAKAKDTVTVAGKKGVVETIADGAVDANATLVFLQCEDCTYVEPLERKLLSSLRHCILTRSFWLSPCTRLLARSL